MKTAVYPPVDESAILAADDAMWDQFAAQRKASAAALPALDDATLAAMDADPFGDGPLPKPKKAKKAYDPGTAGAITRIGPGLYVVSSWRNPQAAPYQVNLGAYEGHGSCTCPDFEKRHKGNGTACKHLTQAKEEASRVCLIKALSLPLERLEAQAQREDLRPEIHAAVEKALRVRVVTQRGYARV